MKFIREFIDHNVSATDRKNLDDENRKHDLLKKAKLEIYNSMSPAMADIYEDMSDYFLDLTEKYGSRRHSDLRPTIDLDMLDLCVDIGQEEAYTIAHERDYIFNRGQLVKVSTGDIDVEKKLSMYLSDFDWKFLNYYNAHSGKVDPYYSFRIGFDSGYGTGYKNWTEEDIKNMTDELVSSSSRVIRRINGKIVKLSSYNPIKSEKGNFIIDSIWNDVASKDLKDIKYPRFAVGFRLV